MRTTTLKGLLSVLVFMTLCVVSAKAVNITQQITIYMDEAGKLPDKISSSEKYQITNLKIIGKIDGTDLRMIREMAGRDVDGNATNGNLAILDLSEAQIVSGGKYYYYTLDSYTKNNILGEYAFYDCSNLTSVTLPNSVTSIENYAFDGCTGLTSVNIPNSVKSIGRYAFDGCSGLTSVDIPNSVTSIGEAAFWRCTGLTSVDIPNSVTSIGQGVFYGCTGLTSVEIPSSVTSIGNWAFSGCSELKSVTIPNSVTSIGNWAFNWCTGLTSVDIPNSVTSIGEAAFWRCTGLTSVTIPGSVTSIGDYAFDGCTGLTSVDIPNSVTSIGNYAFEGCTGLTDVTIPGSVTSIGDNAFDGCTGLESILVAPENGTYDSRDNCNAIIETKTNTLIVGCKNTTIPNSVTSIGEYAFYECTGLTSVTIPNSVTNIEYGAFWGCTGLEKIESLAETPPTCGSSVFSGVDKNKCVLSVPEKSINAYKTAYGWKDFLQIISGIHGVAQDNNAGVSARNGEITVTGAADNAVVEVYSTSGALVYRGTSKTVSVPSAGIYIVKTAGRTFKVKTAR